LKEKKITMTGIILAGGKNTRMGVNKAFLEINGTRMIDKTIDIYSRLFSEILIITNDPLPYLEFTRAASLQTSTKAKVHWEEFTQVCFIQKILTFLSVLATCPI